MNSAMIHFEPCFSRMDQGIFLKRTLKKIKKTIKVENYDVLIYKIPICIEKPSERAIQKFILLLKEDLIKNIILSDDAASLPFLEEFKKHFNIIDGASVINYRIYDILRKCVSMKENDLSDCSIILYTNTPELAKECILKIYKHVRKIKIESQKPDLFFDLTSFFLYEYGIFIEINQQKEKQEKELSIVLDDNLESADLFYFNEKKSEILFTNKNYFKEFKKFRNLTQSSIEFLIDQFYGNIDNQSIKMFFKTYPLRISKIKNND